LEVVHLTVLVITRCLGVFTMVNEWIRRAYVQLLSIENLPSRGQPGPAQSPVARVCPVVSLRISQTFSALDSSLHRPLAVFGSGRARRLNGRDETGVG